VVVITEATSVSGEAIARYLSREGASLVIGARDVPALTELANELTWDGGKVLAFETDMTESPQVTRLVTAADNTLGRIDVMVNNPGSFPNLPVGDDETADVNLIAGLDLLGIVHGVVAAVPHLRRRRGHIINVAPFAVTGHGEDVAFATTYRQTVLAASEWLRKQVAPHGIRTTLIAPGPPRAASWRDAIPLVARLWNRGAGPAATIARAVAFAIGQADDMEIDEILLSEIQRPPFMNATAV
jgi:NADP-dependent 3-hydroxy acid dehydrogenase YdfG